jgi:hypothetical protein
MLSTMMRSTSAFIAYEVLSRAQVWAAGRGRSRYPCRRSYPGNRGEDAVGAGEAPGIGGFSAALGLTIQWGDRIAQDTAIIIL